MLIFLSVNKKEVETLNSKAEEVLAIIINDENRTKEFLKQETMDEMYAFFLKIDSSISKDDFDTFIVKMLDSYDAGAINKLNDESLGAVSGGVGNAGAKIAAAVLSALAALPSLGSMAHAADISGVATQSSSVASKIKNFGLSAVDLAKKGWNKTSQWVINNPKKAAALGAGIAAAVVGAGVVVYKVRSSQKAAQEISESTLQNSEMGSADTQETEQSNPAAISTPLPMPNHPGSPLPPPPPPPLPPPLPAAHKPASKPLPKPNSNPSSSSDDVRSGILAAIKGGVKLKKTTIAYGTKERKANPVTVVIDDPNKAKAFDEVARRDQEEQRKKAAEDAKRGKAADLVKAKSVIDELLNKKGPLKTFEKTRVRNAVASHPELNTNAVKALLK